jgi:phage gp45-like
MRRIAPTLAAATAIAGLCLTAAPAGANIASAGRAGASRPATPARALAAAALARHQAKGTFTGIVLGPSARPLGRICITAAGQSSTTTAVTRPDGRYELTGLRAGRYVLRYSECAGTSRYLGSTAAAIVAPGQVKALATVTMRPAAPAALIAAQHRRQAVAAGNGTGQIRGLVTGNGHPAAGVCVEAFPVRGGLVPTTTTSATGRYTLRGVAAGRYQVEFADGNDCADPGNWLSQWYKGITALFQPEHAIVLRVSKGGVLRGIDASLRRGSEIGGAVRSKSGRPLAGVCVTINARVRGGYLELGIATGANGRYAAHGLFPGTYTVGFSVGCGSHGNYAPQWWRGADSLHAATRIKITAPRMHTRIGAVLRRGSAIVGTVRGGTASGPRLAGICVDATGRRNGVSASTRTRRGGAYRLIGLAAGTYSVGYQAACGNRGNYLPASRRVTVGQASTTRGVNVVLRRGAGLSGLVTNLSSRPIGGICVQANGRRGTASYTVTNPDGTYSMTSVPPGRYTVEFLGGCGNSGSYLPVYYNGKSSAASADPVVLTAGHVTTGINASMPAGGTITGTVTNAAGHRLSGVCIGIGTSANLLIGDYDDIEFSRNGSYRASNLVPGQYTVTFGCGDGTLADQWFPDQPSADSARAVSVPAGQVTTGISAVMHQAGKITGMVRSDGGQPLSGICVQAVRAGHPYPAAIGAVPGATIARHGRYTIGQLAAGRYAVQFLPCAEPLRYASQWYRGKRSQRTATLVAVRAGRITPGVDARLGTGASISGRILTSSGHGAPRYCVTVSDDAADSFGFAETGHSGRYVIRHLASGSYLVYAGQCSAGAYTQRQGTVKVRAPRMRTGIDVRIPASGSVAGTVLLARPGSGPAAYDCVAVVPARPGRSYGYATAGKRGHYRVSQLAAGTYHVYFGDADCFFAESDLAPQWYDNKPTKTLADPVTVKVGSTTSGIDAALAPDGTVTGTVTDRASAPVGGECVTAYPVGSAPDPLYGFRPEPEVAVTSADGRYTLSDVLPGRYQIQFASGCGASGYASQWWKDARTKAAATAITVAAGAVISGISATLGR